MTDRSERKRVNENMETNIDYSIFTKKWMALKEVKRLESQTGIMSKRGRFSKREDSRLKSIVESYLEEHGIPMQNFIDSITERSRGLRSLVDYCELGMRLNTGRPAIRVYHHVRKTYHPRNFTSHFTEKEDEQLKRLVALYGPQWEKISKEMEKFNISVRDRYHTIRHSYNKGCWSEEEERKLVDIMNYMRSTPIVTSFWLTVSTKLGTRSVTQCILKWYDCLEYKSRPQAMRRRFSDVDNYKLINTIYELAVYDESEIVWRDLAWGEFAFSTATKLKTHYYILKKRVTNAASLDLDDVLESLLRSLHPAYTNWLKEQQLIQNEETRT